MDFMAVRHGPPTFPKQISYKVQFAVPIALLATDTDRSPLERSP